MDDIRVDLDDLSVPEDANELDLPDEGDSVPVFSDPSLAVEVARATVERDDSGLVAHLVSPVDADRLAQRLLPVLVPPRLAGLCFGRRRARHRHYYG